MDEHESFSNSIYKEQTHLAERELSAFIGAVTKLFGPEQARTSAAEDWPEESVLMDRPSRSTARDWRSVTIAASARLASRVKVTPTHEFAQRVATTNTKVSPIPSSNCLGSTVLF